MIHLYIENAHTLLDVTSGLGGAFVVANDLKEVSRDGRRTYQYKASQLCLHFSDGVGKGAERGP